ncbi:MAG: hypothetical protein ACMUIL_14455 [bacterium]
MKKGKINKRMLACISLALILLLCAVLPAHALAPFYYYSKYLSPYLFYAYLPTTLPYYYPTYIDPTLLTSPLLTVPTATAAPTALASGLLIPFFPSPIIPVIPTSFIAPAVADFLINTGNPQVDAVLGLIAFNPLLLNDPLLLNSLINTGNPDVASALAFVSTVFAP